MANELTALLVAVARVEEKVDAIRQDLAGTREDHEDLRKYTRGLSSRTGKLEQFRSWVIGVGVGLTALGGISLLTAFMR